MTTIRERLKAALLQASKERQLDAIKTLRTTLAAIDNAEAVDVTPALRATLGDTTEVVRKSLTETQIETIVRREIEDLRAHIANYEQVGRTEQAASLRAGVEVLERHL